MTADEIEAFLAASFPEAKGFGTIEDIGERHLVMRMPFRAEYLRPGNTLSGPSLMTLADTAAYFLILAMIGPVALAVTSSFQIHFLAKPKPTETIAHATMLKLGKRLAVVSIEMRSDGDPELVAHATATYALPARS